MLATLQKIITLSVLTAATSWLLYFSGRSPWLAGGGFLVIAVGYTGFLAIEFIALRFVNASDPAPQPTWKELLAAWWGESKTAPQVFFWRQPFRAQAVPDELAAPAARKGKRGVVFVHGFFCNRGLWTPYLRRLQGSGHAFTAISLEPVFGSIDDYAPQIDEAVRQVTDATGLSPLVVCHSMGGLAVRAWLKIMRAENRVHHIVTIGTPHHGTWLARFAMTRNSQQMRQISGWLQTLSALEPAGRSAHFTCFYSHCDNIVFPAATATLPGADNRHLPGVAHVHMADRPEPWAELQRWL